MSDIVVKGAKQFVCVAWWDAEDYTAAGWASQEETDAFNAHPCLALSYGYLVSKTKHYITLAADFIAPATYGRLMKIPRKMIQGPIRVIDITPPDVV